MPCRERRPTCDLVMTTGTRSRSSLAHRSDSISKRCGRPWSPPSTPSMERAAARCVATRFSPQLRRPWIRRDFSIVPQRKVIRLPWPHSCAPARIRDSRRGYATTPSIAISPRPRRTTSSFSCSTKIPEPLLRSLRTSGTLWLPVRTVSHCLAPTSWSRRSRTRSAMGKRRMVVRSSSPSRRDVRGCPRSWPRRLGVDDGALWQWRRRRSAPWRETRWTVRR